MKKNNSIEGGENPETFLIFICLKSLSYSSTTLHTLKHLLRPPTFIICLYQPENTFLDLPTIVTCTYQPSNAFLDPHNLNCHILRTYINFKLFLPSYSFRDIVG